MPALRFLLVLLILLNLLALAAANGWLGQSTPRGEPERITNQINPQSLILDQQDPAASDAAAPTPLPVPLATLPPEPLPAPGSTGSGAVSAVSDNVEAPAEEATPVPASAAASPASPPMAVPTNPVCWSYTGLSEDDSARYLASLQAAGDDVSVSRLITDPAGNWWVHIAPAADRASAERRATSLRASGVSDLFIVRDEGPNLHAISLGQFRTEASANQHLADLRARRITDAIVMPRRPAVYEIRLTGAQAVVEAVAQLADLPGEPVPCAP